MKLRNLSRAILFVYKQAPFFALTSDVLFIISVAVEMAAITFGGRFIDATAQILSTWKEFSFNAYFVSDSFFFLCMVLVLWIVLLSANNARAYFMQIVYRRYLRKAQSNLFDKLSTENLQEIETKKFQDLLAYVPNYSIPAVYNAYSNFSEFFRQGIRMVVALGFVFATMGPSAFVLVVFFAPEAMAEYYYKRKIAKDVDSSMEKIKLIYYIEGFIRDIANFIELKVDRGFSFLRKVHKEHTNDYDKSILYRNKHMSIDKSFFATLGKIASAVYLVVAIAAAVAQRLTIGNFKALYDYIMASADSIYGVFSQLFLMLDSNMYIDKYFDFVDYKGFGDVSVGTAKLQKGTPVLAFQNLDYQYADGTNKVLENVNFKIDAGDKVAFIGGDGSGKSTLVKMLCGLYEVTAGDYVVGKYSARELERGDLKDRISLVTQDFNKYSLSIKENITIGEKDQIKHVLYEKAKRICGIDEFIEHEGITEDQRLGKAFDKSREISPGYWQRIAIARALYRNKQIFILDEPFTYIDQDARRKILKSIFTFIGPDRTLICIFQDTENIDLFDRVYTLKHGKVQQMKSAKVAK